jgi:membrane-anchored mycosin MYCP
MGAPEYHRGVSTVDEPGGVSIQRGLNEVAVVVVVLAGPLVQLPMGGLIVAMRRGRLRRPLSAVALALVVVLGSVATGGAAAGLAAGPTYVKYYVVAASYEGKPENLAAIAGRFLASTARSEEIFTLNVGVVQPDGGRLTDPNVLRAGWVLILPWDAVGNGVKYGLPPTTAPVKPTSGTAPARPTASAGSPSTPSGGGRRPPDAACAGSPSGSVSGSQARWATLRLAPERAWDHTRGQGVLVAVIDSGVDAAVPELSNRVSVGVDIIGGTGRGDTDCLGTGTAMAGIVVEMAPESTVMPVRVATTAAPVSEANQATAIEVAVSAGARVIALGLHVDPARPAVARAIESAVGHDVVVVQAAPSSSVPQTQAIGGVVRVGAIGIDGALAGKHHLGGVDVVAPGVDVLSVGISGTGRVQRSGAQYAASFVAGAVALVRSMYPNLTAAQVARRIEATADRIGVSAPDARYGWGLIDPVVAVTRVIADEGRGPDAPAPLSEESRWSSQRTWALVITILVGLILVVLLALRMRRMVRSLAPADPQPESKLALQFAGSHDGGRLGGTVTDQLVGTAVGDAARTEGLGSRLAAHFEARPADRSAVQAGGQLGASERPPLLQRTPGASADR